MKQPNFSSPLSLKDIKYPIQHANVETIITSLLPEKTDSRFFEGELTECECVLGIVGFEKHQRQRLDSFCANGVPVTLTNCQVQLNKLKDQLEIVVKR